VTDQARPDRAGAPAEDKAAGAGAAPDGAGGPVRGRPVSACALRAELGPLIRQAPPAAPSSVPSAARSWSGADALPMPTYDYVCGGCGHRFEHFQGINAAPLEQCPRCGGKLRRLIGAGAGFLTRDSARSAGRERLSRCGHASPCCGRAEPCDSPSCEH